MPRNEAQEDAEYIAILERVVQATLLEEGCKQEDAEYIAILERARTDEILQEHYQKGVEYQEEYDPRSKPKPSEPYKIPGPVSGADSWMRMLWQDGGGISRSNMDPAQVKELFHVTNRTGEDVSVWTAIFIVLLITLLIILVIIGIGISYFYNNTLLLWISFIGLGIVLVLLAFYQNEIHRGESSHSQAPSGSRTPPIGPRYRSPAGFDVLDVHGLMPSSRSGSSIPKTPINFRDVPDRSRNIPSHVKQTVWNRDGGMCVECGSRINLQYDHNIPFSKGGAHSVENVQILCQSCNARKRDKIV